MLNAVRDAERLTPWIEPNAQALPRAERAVLRALSAPVPHDIPNGVALLRYADGREPVLLLDAVLDPPRPQYTTFVCDLDLAPTKGHQNIIWIPCGASVVQLTVRGLWRDIFMHAAPNLVWF